MVQLGWKAGPEQFPPAELLDYAVAAEKAGFDSIDVSDHFNPWSEAGQAAFPWTWLGAVAARTSRIHMGTGVTCPILRYHPAIIAQAAATLTHLAPGRVYLGVGTGEALNEYAATGEWPEYEERQEMLAEAIDLIRALWSGEEVSFDGAYYTTRKAKLHTPPTSPIPIFVSALVPDSAKFAGQYGDGLFTVGGKKPDLYKQILKNFEDSAREAGKDPSQMPRLIELNVEYTDELDSAIEYQLSHWAGAYVPALFDQKSIRQQCRRRMAKSSEQTRLKRLRGSPATPMIMSNSLNNTLTWVSIVSSFTPRCPTRTPSSKGLPATCYRACGNVHIGTNKQALFRQ